MLSREFENFLFTLKVYFPSCNPSLLFSVIIGFIIISSGLILSIALGPRPRSFKYRVNKKERRLAIRSVLSSKVLENELVVVDSLPLNEIKTKNMVNALTNLKVEGKTLIVIPTMYYSFIWFYTKYFFF